MHLCRRAFKDEADFWRMRAFLREVFLRNGRRERAWQAYRLDYWRQHGLENLEQGSLGTDVFLWETTEGQLAGFLNSEGRGNAFLQIHPDYNLRELAVEMLGAAEEHLPRETTSGHRLNVWVNEHAHLQQDVLTDRGYSPGKWAEYQRRRSLAIPVPDVPVPEGYVVRALGGEDELPARSWASWTAFHPDEPDEKYEGWEWYRSVQRCPLYRRDLDIVAVAPDGRIASFCTVWFDDVTRTGAFEPVGTDKHHQRRGLGKAVIAEGLRRLQQFGATLAFVGSYEDPAHRLYESMGFVEYEKAVQWVREW